MKRPLLLIVFIFLFSNIGIAENMNFKERTLKRIGLLHNQSNRKIEIADDENFLIYAIVPKNPVSKKGVLLRLLIANRPMLSGKEKSSSIGEITEREYIYSYKFLEQKEIVVQYKVLNRMKLFISLESKIIPQENEDEVIYDNRERSSDIFIPFADSSGTGTLALFCEDNSNDNLINSYSDYYVIFKLVGSDRILVEIKNK